MDVFECMKSRTEIREYKKDPVPDDLIEKIDRYLNIEMTHINLRKHET